MRAILSVFLCFLVAITGSTQQSSIKDSLIKDLSEIYKQGFINGFAVGIVSSDSVLFTKGFGYSDTQKQTSYTATTIQNIGSISKTVIGLALLKAQELGKLNLDDPINQYLPFEVFNPLHPNTEITIRHLATHTSSLLDRKYKKAYLPVAKKYQNPNGSRKYTKQLSKEALEMPAFLERLFSPTGKWYSKKNFSKNKPGVIFEYSNLATALAAHIVELAVEEPFSAFTQKYIFEPLNMTNTGWRLQDIDFSKHSKLYDEQKKEFPFYQLITYPDGGLRTTAADLSIYLGELISGYNGSGKILANDAYRELFRQQLEEHNFTDRNEKSKYSDEYNTGILMGFSAKGYVGHTGEDPGVVALMFFNVETSMGKILILNTEIGKAGQAALVAIWKKLAAYEDKFLASIQSSK